MIQIFLEEISHHYKKMYCRLPMVLVLFCSMAIVSCAPRLKPEKIDPMPVLADKALTAAMYHDKGKNDFKKGKFESAIQNWTQSKELYKNLNNADKQSAVMVDLSRAFQTVGRNTKAMDILESALILAEASGNKNDQAVIMAHLGNLKTISGNEDQAEQYLDRSMALSKNLDDPELTASILNHQGNLLLLKKEYQPAVQTYAKGVESAKASPDQLLTITVLINAARASLKINPPEKTSLLLDEALERLNHLENSHFKSFGLINTGLAYYDLGKTAPGSENPFRLLCYQIFSQAAEVAGRLDDQRTLSYALGYAGRLYEDTGRYTEALSLTRNAEFVAQKIYAPESLYRWQWQAGRILKQMNDIEGAVAAFRRTLFTLQAIRREIDNCHDIQQASFRNIAGSVAFEMVDLLLQQTRLVTDSKEHETLLLEARDVVELLRVYELRNYFKDDCVDAGAFNTVSLDDISKTAVVIYPVLLEDRTELLVSLPSGLKQFTLSVDRETLTQEIRDFRRKLEKRTTWEFLPHARKLYDYLIRPYEPDLLSAGIHTLVFVPSGPLRTVPMAALQDGQHFLIEKYATAITPGLNLIDPTPIQRENINILAAGITEASQGFPPLPEVASELKNIGSMFSGKLLLNQDFLVSSMETELKKEVFTIVHIASHGQFQGDVNQTFVLAFDDKLTMNTLDKYAGFLQFRKTPLDLLALSACESAAGDDMAALGMAGVAVKAGARSALATLWFINDMASSVLIKEFYHQIENPSVSRAVALQQAQLNLAGDPRFNHPGYWSPFLLINNWL